MNLNLIAKNLFTGWISNRLLRNVLFWILLGYTVVSNMTTLTNEIVTTKQKIVLFFMYFVLYGPIVYFNNLFLLPRFFAKGDYFKYFTLAAISILAYTFYAGGVIDYYSSLTPSDLPSPTIEDLSYFVGVIRVSFWVATFSMIKLGTDHLVNKSNLEILEREKARSELDSLKNQINPHFLFNGLNTIYGLSIANDLRTSDSIMKLSEIMRYVLYECNDDYVSLERNDYINNYINFGKLRRKRVDQIEFNIDGDISNKKIVPHILIPFIENAFKHGLDANIIDPWIKLNMQIVGHTLLFSCANSKSNRKEVSKKDSGIGLFNVKRRLELLCPDGHYISIDDKEDVYSVDLKLDLC